MSDVADISVVICTRNRGASLQETLSCLAAADRSSLRVEVVIVDNGGEDATRQVADEFYKELNTRYLLEPVLGKYGKSHALNRALDEGNLGEIVAILDDDMSPAPGWFQGVAESRRRWPDADIFGGRTHIIWPMAEPPRWCLDPAVTDSIFSAADRGGEYKELAPGSTFSGNHFWFRSRVLADGHRFADIWLTEPDFMLSITESGGKGYWAPAAVAGHRVQPGLMDKMVAKKRAVFTGRSTGELRLLPHRHNPKVEQFRRHPFLCQCLFAGKFLRWSWTYGTSRLSLDSDKAFASSLRALSRLSAYQEMLKLSKSARAAHSSRPTGSLPEVASRS